MRPSELEQFLSADAELSPYLTYFKSVAKPSVDISIGRRWPGATQSRFGGSPAVGTEFVWPTHKVGEYRFLGQFNFGEIDGAPEMLPDSGLLSLFYAYDDAGEVFWGDDGFVIGYYWHSTKKLRLADAPNQMVPKPRKISFEPGVDIPRYDVLRSDWPLDDSATCALSELAHNDLPKDYLLGFPSFYTLGYDPTPGLEWVQLVTLDSREQFGWCWHDTCKLMVFIEKDRLARKDFSNLKCDVG